MPEKPEKTPHFDMTELETSAVQMHELYREMRKAGFTRAEAIDFLARMVAYGSSNPSTDE